MSWANMAVTAYDVAQQIRMIYAGEASILGLTFALAKGFIVQALITCAATAALGEAAVWVLKAVNISMDSVSFVEAVKSGDPEKIIVESLRLSVSLFTLTCQCFTGETLVSTEKGETRIDEIKPGDMVWSYDTEKGERVLKKVTKVKESETDVIVHVKTSDGKDINTTMFHPFMTGKEGRREWKAASNLQKGDNLITENGESVYVEEVRVEKLAESVKVYNLEVEDLHVYYVAGVLVHNKCGGTIEDESTEIVSYYPENNGAIRGTEEYIYIEEGEIIDRFGKSTGKYFAPVGTPLEMRALPYDADLTNYHQYEVVKPFEVEVSIIAPAFGNIGLGTQYRSFVSVKILLKRGIIKELGDS